jgi:hypothetical protein
MAIQKPDTFFSELDSEERERADEWLFDYLRLIVRIHREYTDSTATDLSTTRRLTDSTVLARSVRFPHPLPLTTPDENILDIHAGLDSQTGREGRVA